jgi:lipopolysaccharide export system protein LptC
VEELELTTFDAGGTPLRRLQAARLVHYRGSGDTRLLRPRFTLFEQERELWRIVSESGLLAQDHSRLELEGEVKIRRRGDSRHPPLHIETRDLLVKPDTEYAETAAPVKITSDDNRISAVGMRAWLRPPGHIRFLSQTRAYYAVQ